MASEEPLNIAMLRHLRTSPAVRMFLCVAALLAVAASFGLHPEPGDGLAPSATAFAKFHAPETAHGCVACLTHGAALTSPLSGILLAGAPGEPASLVAEPLSRARLSGTDLPGRSPPLDRS